jgi:hypothetical protein
MGEDWCNKHKWVHIDKLCPHCEEVSRLNLQNERLQNALQRCIDHDAEDGACDHPGGWRECLRGIRSAIEKPVGEGARPISNVIFVKHPEPNSIEKPKDETCAVCAGDCSPPPCHCKCHTTEKRKCEHKTTLTFDGLGVRPKCQLCGEWVLE